MMYKFDENLRELFLNTYCRLNDTFVLLLSYSFTEKYGENQFHYLNPVNYTNNRKCAMDIHRLIKTLDKLANSNSDYPYITHQ